MRIRKQKSPSKVVIDITNSLHLTFTSELTQISDKLRYLVSNIRQIIRAYYVCDPLMDVSVQSVYTPAMRQGRGREFLMEITDHIEEIVLTRNLQKLSGNIYLGLYKLLSHGQVLTLIYDRLQEKQNTHLPSTKF